MARTSSSGSTAGGSSSSWEAGLEELAGRWELLEEGGGVDAELGGGVWLLPEELPWLLLLLLG